METIFDHDVTDEEIKELFFGVANKEEYFDLADSQSDNLEQYHILNIYRLYSIRENVEKAREYFNKIEGRERLRFTLEYQDVLPSR